jgi:hypothetical protein
MHRGFRTCLRLSCDGSGWWTGRRRGPPPASGPARESLARHGYYGTTAGRGTGPLRAGIAWGVQLVARYLVVSHIRNVSTRLRNLYGLREIQATPGTQERRELRRAELSTSYSST